MACCLKSYSSNSFERKEDWCFSRLKSSFGIFNACVVTGHFKNSLLATAARTDALWYRILFFRNYWRLFILTMTWQTSKTFHQYLVGFEYYQFNFLYVSQLALSSWYAPKAHLKELLNKALKILSWAFVSRWFKAIVSAKWADACTYHRSIALLSCRLISGV